MTTSKEVWKAKIPDFDLSSPNKLLRMHYGQRMRIKKAVAVKLMAFGSEIESANNKSSRVKVEINRLYGFRKRSYDLDNLYGSCKLLLDAMVDLGIIPGDTPHHIDLVVKQEKSPERTSFVEILVSEPK